MNMKIGSGIEGIRHS
jgi:hypothetical protein